MIYRIGLFKAALIIVLLLCVLHKSFAQTEPLEKIDADKYQYILSNKSKDGYVEVHEARDKSKDAIHVYYNNNHQIIRRKVFSKGLLVKDSGTKGSVEYSYQFDKNNRLVTVDVIENFKDLKIEDIGKQLYHIVYEYDKEGNVKRIYKEYDDTSIHEGKENREIFLEYDDTGKLISKGSTADGYIALLKEKDSRIQRLLAQEKKKRIEEQKRVSLKALGIIKVVVEKVTVKVIPLKAEKNQLDIQHHRSFDNRRYLVFNASDGSLLGEAKWSDSAWTIQPLSVDDIWMLVPQKIVKKTGTKGGAYTSIEEGYIRKTKEKTNEWEVYDRADRVLYDVEVLYANNTLSATLRNQDTYDFSDADFDLEKTLENELDKNLKKLEGLSNKRVPVKQELIDIESVYRDYFKKNHGK